MQSPSLLTVTRLFRQSLPLDQMRRREKQAITKMTVDRDRRSQGCRGTNTASESSEICEERLPSGYGISSKVVSRLAKMIDNSRLLACGVRSGAFFRMLAGLAVPATSTLTSFSRDIQVEVVNSLTLSKESNYKETQARSLPATKSSSW